MRIARVFPRRTTATPCDDLAFYDGPPLWPVEADEVHVSVTFTWDIPKAKRLAEEWKTTGLPVKVGGPATGMRGEEFVSGRYVKHGYTITSRGCPNRCWFCSVWRREGQEVRTLPIRSGWNVLDDNILATPKEHFIRVCEMLSRQDRAPEFTGGLEAKLLTEWHAKMLRALKVKQLFFAYDTPDDLEPLQRAGRILLEAGFTTASHTLRCYVLCGFAKDTLVDAERRMMETVDAGFMPMAMVWRNSKGEKSQEWASFQRQWARPALIAGRRGET